jgi:hypothetical protein
MPQDHPFALFVEDRKGPLFRGYCDDLREANCKAQELADHEGFPFVVFSFTQARQLGRFEPRPHKSLDA